MTAAQGLAYMGYITLNWTTVHKDIIRRLDINRDGSFDASDAKSVAASGLAVLAQARQLPSSFFVFKPVFRHTATATGVISYHASWGSA